MSDLTESEAAKESDIPHVVKVAPTICGVWENYKLYLSRGANLAQWHRHVPSLFMYDDHEILNDITVGIENLLRRTGLEFAGYIGAGVCTSSVFGAVGLQL